MASVLHDYAAHLTWEGNTGTGTSSYDAYRREYRVQVAGKPILRASADPAFRGDPALPNPEDLFLASIAACHMLFYLALCAQHGVAVLAYEDQAQGQMETRGSGGRFVEVVLHPQVTIASGSDPALAMSLHDIAHARCFIANSCSVPIHHQARIEVAGIAVPTPGSDVR